MPRVVKHPDLRRQELLDCAQAVFLAHGYENASLNDVIAAAGSSKGAFYHYFASKEALLEALAERFARQALAQVQDVLDDESVDALTRLNAFLARSWQNKLEMAPTAWALFAVLYRPENFVLFHRINSAAAALFAPALTRLVQQGVRDGTFRTVDPEGVADMLLQLGAATHAIIARAITVDGAELDDAIAALERRIRLYEIALNSVLGVADGRVRLASPGSMRAMMASARPAGMRRKRVAKRRAKG
jgi:AcrR family transcriptional regulator